MFTFHDKNYSFKYALLEKYSVIYTSSVNNIEVPGVYRDASPILKTTQAAVYLASATRQTAARTARETKRRDVTRGPRSRTHAPPTLTDTSLTSL